MTGPTLLIRLLRTGFASIFVGALILLLVRVWFGPLPGWISVRTAVSWEALACLAFCGTLVGGGLQAPRFAQGSVSAFVTSGLLAVIAVSTAGAFAESFRAPFLFDYYRHVLFAANESWLGLLNRVVLHHPTGGISSFDHWETSCFSGFTNVGISISTDGMWQALRCMS